MGHRAETAAPAADVLMNSLLVHLFFMLEPSMD